METNFLSRKTPLLSRLTPNLQFFFWCFAGSGLIAAGLQSIIEPTSVNLMSAGICLLGTVVALGYLFGGGRMARSPFSTFSIFGATLIMLWGPLVYTTMEWRAITFELKVPFMTFGWGAIVALTLCLSHFIYDTCGLRVLFTKGGRFIFRYFGFFQRPPDLLFWAMGSLGFVAFMYIYFYRSEAVFSGTDQGLVFRLVQGLTPFCYTPFVLLLMPYFQGGNNKVNLFNMIGCAVFFFALLLGALFSNSRGVFATPIMTIFLLAAFLGFQGKLRIDGRLRILVAIGIPIGLLGLAFLTDLALAMRIARADRATADASVIFHETLAVMGDKKYMTSYREELNSVGQDPTWSEYYLSSPFLSRFVNTKFADNTLAFLADYSAADVEEIKRFTWDRMLVVLPTPVLTRLNLNVSKDYVLSQSMGDFMLMIAKGVMLPGLRSGSFIASGVVVWGYAFPLVLLIAAIPVFAFFDSLFCPVDQLVSAKTRKLLGSNPLSVSPRVFAGIISVSPFALIFLYDFFIFWTIESISGVVLFLVRVIFQKILFYWIFLKGYNACLGQR